MSPSNASHNSQAPYLLHHLITKLFSLNHLPRVVYYQTKPKFTKKIEAKNQKLIENKNKKGLFLFFLAKIDWFNPIFNYNIKNQIELNQIELISLYSYYALTTI